MATTYFSRLLVELMQEKNINQIELAKALGIKQSQVSNWCNGKSKPNYDSIKKICDYFDVSADMVCDTKFDD
jgi:transcriptional regulator with XRE-family HTH domain